MARIILTSDRSLISEYRNVPLLSFLGCAPAEWVPAPLFRLLGPSLPHRDGLLLRAPYNLRKLQAALLRTFRPGEVAVVHPDRIARWIGPETTAVLVSEMDPLGFGPLTMMFTNGGRLTGYSKACFLELVRNLRELREKRNLKFKIVVGGPGAWHFDHRPGLAGSLGIDHVVHGETDHVLHEMVPQIESGTAPFRLLADRPPEMAEIPRISAPSAHGLIECMRGCGRNCEFCDPNLRRSKYFPVEEVVAEVRVNARAGVRNAWVHSEDIFLYGCQDRRTMQPNGEALVELFSAIMAEPGIAHANATHGTVCAAAADPEMVTQLSRVLRAGPDNVIGLQCGLETGSASLMERHMPRKALPFSAAEWPEAVLEGTRVLNENYWVPAYTCILGLPGETEEDVWETLALFNRMERWLPQQAGARAHFTVTPMCFVPMGALKDRGFYDIGSSLNEARFCLLYRAWRRTVMEANSYLPRILKSPYTRLLMRPLVGLGGALLIRHLEKWGIRMGFDPSKAFRVNGMNGCQ